MVPGVAQVTSVDGLKDGMDDFDELTQVALRARRGDAAAAAEFVRATQADVWRLCAHLGSPAQADDLTQDTYARAFASLHRFLGRASARTWLLSIARRVCADAVRSAVRSRRIAAAPERSSDDPASSVAMRSLIAGLEPERREAFVLTQILGRSYAEAADTCDCPVGTIRSRAARARADLVAALDSGARGGQSAAGTG